MDSNPQSKLPDNSDVKPSFRKHPNDSANRKYRRRSPSSGSSSSSSDGSPMHDRSRSLYYSKENSIKMSDNRWKRKDDEKDLDRDSGRNRSGKDTDSYRQGERKSYRNSYDPRRHDDYSRHRRHADGEERVNQKPSRYERESRNSDRSDHMRKDNEPDRSRENWRNNERYSRDRSDDRGHRNKDTERETADIERHRHNNNDLSSEKSSYGRRQPNSNFDELKMGERERHRDGGGDRDDKRDHRSSGDHKSDYASNHEEFRGHTKGLAAGRDSGASCLKDTHKRSSREANAQKEDMMRKRKHDDREHDSGSSSSPREKNSRNELCQAAVKSPSSSNHQENVTKLASATVPSSASEVESSNDLDAAKLAAMKAAELVNRNLVGSGYMSIDQKKKLLWGNKKTTAAEESGNRWGGMPLFSDQERQEKFNKLMGVKGDLKMEQKPDDKDGSSHLRAEQQEQLQLDLEKQYTAGLRRRDGRTVGLGL